MGYRHPVEAKRAASVAVRRTTMNSETLDLEGLARWLRKDVRELSKWADRGRLPGRKVGGQWRFSRSEIGQWISTQLPEFSDAELQAMEQVPAASEPVSDLLLSQLLSEATIAIPLPATTRSSVLRELVKLAEQSWQIYDPEAILRAIQEREAQGSTAMEGGWAVPHPYQPNPSALGDSVVAFGRTLSPIPFGAADRQPTDLFFLVCCTDHRTHVRTLARLARLARTPGFLDSLREATDAHEAYSRIRQQEEQLLASE